MIGKNEKTVKVLYTPKADENVDMHAYTDKDVLFENIKLSSIKITKN